MSLKIDRWQLELDIKPNKSQQELQALNVQLTEANKKLTQLGNERDKINASIKKENAQDAGSRDYNKIEVLKTKLEEVNKEYDQQVTVVRKAKVAMDSQLETIGITGLTLSQLTQRQKELNNIVRHLTPDSADYNKYKAQLDEVNARMKSLKGTAVETKGSLQGLSEGFNKYAAIAATAAAALAGMGISGSKSVQDFADMKEAESQVVKYTNLTKAEVEDLNEEFKKMDTRTSREELNKLAGDAGKLGIDGKKNILDFVDAGNQIKIALGEDLGQDAITNIGKIASMFGDDKKLGLKQAMLSSGSAINQLGQDSNATEAYILDFTYRLSGAGKQAKITQTDIMGLASVLDQNGQEVETSSTAISQLLIKMYQDPAKFAKLAGIDVKEFVNLLKTNGNDALIKFSTAMKDKGGFAELAPMFEKMNLDGTRSVGVLSTVADNVVAVKKAQIDAAEAYSKATSVTKEYDKQNSTSQAQLDKKKKALHDISVELGEKLFPATLDLMSAETKLAKAAAFTISTLYNYRYTVATLSSLIVVYTIYLYSHVIAQKLVAFWNNVIAASFKKLWATMIANPYIAITAGIIILISFIVDLIRNNNELSESQRKAAIESNARRKAMEDEAEAMKEANEKYADQKTRVEILTKTIHDNNASLDSRKKAIEDLKKIIPDYHASISKEGTIYNENTKAIDTYLANIKKMALAEAMYDKLKAAMGEQANAEMAADTWNKAVNRREDLMTQKGHESNTQRTYSSGAFGAGGGVYSQDESNKVRANDELMLAHDKERQKIWNEALAEKRKVVENINNYIKEKNLQDAMVKTATKENTNTGDYVDPKEADRKEKERKKAEVAARKTATANQKDESKDEKLENANYDKQLAELKSSLSKKEITQNEYHDSVYQAEVKHLGNILDIQKNHHASEAKVTETGNKILDAITEETNYQYEKRKKDMNDDLIGLDDAYNSDKISLAQSRLSGEISTEEEYQNKMKESEIDYLEKKLEIEKKYDQDSTDTEKEILDIKRQQQKEGLDKQKADAEQAYESEKNLDQKSLMNQSMYDAKLIDYEKYQKNKTDIAKTEAEQRTQIEDAALQTVSNLASSASQLYQSMQSRETTKVENKYSKLIKAAQKAGKDTTKLEEQEDAEKLAIKKKYANKEFQMTVLSVMAKTAEAIMKIAAEWAWNPVMEGILIGATVAEGAVQLAVAKNTRDEASGLYEGGYSDGYTDNGNPRDVAGVIPVHKNEFVANHKAVGNPAVRQFLDVFDAGQKDGTISLMNTTDILDKVRITGGKYDGGYAGNGNSLSNAAQGGYTGQASEGVSNEELLMYLRLISEYTKATAEKETVTIRDIKKKIQHIDTLEKNASR